MDNITHEMRLSNWTKLVQECNASGLPKKQWCAQNQVDEKQFYYWQRRVREEVYALQTCTDSSLLSRAFVEVPSILCTSETKHESKSISATVRINGCVIEIADSASDTFLRQLFGALSYVQ